jgi:hypothetical protein
MSILTAGTGPAPVDGIDGVVPGPGRGSPLDPDGLYESDANVQATSAARRQPERPRRVLA